MRPFTINVFFYVLRGTSPGTAECSKVHETDWCVYTAGPKLSYTEGFHSEMNELMGYLELEPFCLSPGMFIFFKVHDTRQHFH